MRNLQMGLLVLVVILLRQSNQKIKKKFLILVHCKQMAGRGQKRGRRSFAQIHQNQSNLPHLKVTAVTALILLTRKENLKIINQIYLL